MLFSQCDLVMCLRCWNRGDGKLLHFAIWSGSDPTDQSLEEEEQLQIKVYQIQIE